MTESLITLSIVGLLVGFIFSMPVAGPISILVTSNALKGKTKYAKLVTVGASFADFVYVFAAVFGLTNFYSLYQPYIPYVLLVGTFFLIYLGIKIAKTKIDLEHIEDKDHVAEKAERQHRGAFWTGFMLSFLNPTLFLSWLTSSFIIISMVASLGFNVGGLDKSVEGNFKAMHKADADSVAKKGTLHSLHLDSVKLVKRGPSEYELEHMPKYSTLLLSASYAFFLSIGSIIWFFYLTYVLAKNRHRININTINWIIRGLGVILCIFGLALGYQAIQMLA